MHAIFSSRAFRICLVFGGLFLLIRTLVAVQGNVENDSDMWTLHILTSSMLGRSRTGTSNISTGAAPPSSSARTAGIVQRLKSAVDLLLRDTAPPISPSRRGAGESPLIVDWTTFFGLKFSDLTKEPMALCRVQCTYSSDRSLVDRADAVLFHVRDINLNSLPSVRYSFQRYIYFLMESPYHSGIAVSRLSKNFFNWTMTYRLDSDILVDYDRLIPKNAADYPYTKNEYSWDNVTSVVMGKTKMVAQFVSNCHTPSKRENYVERLAKSISVDVYGSCSTKACGRGKAECNIMLTNDYLFYLAFENSVCLDYVTEKFWRMKTLIVPIVLRASDYAEIAPNGSYIAADQFASPKDLAAYLERLANNRTEYLSYFEWTKDFWYSSYTQHYCDLCARLHDDSLPPKSYDNMEEWWMGKGNCQNDFAQKLLTS